jgi:hypothetical protein
LIGAPSPSSSTHFIYNEQFVQSGQYYSLGQKLDKVLMA